MSEPSPEQSFFSIHLKSLTDFADEFTTQIQSLQSPMDHLATMSGTAPQYGAFHEAWSLGAGEQAAVEEMFSLLGQVKTAIAFAGDVTGTVADGYRNADENIAFGLGGPPAGYGGDSGSGSWSHGNGNGPNHDGHWYNDDQNDQGNQNNHGIRHPGVTTRLPARGSRTRTPAAPSRPAVHGGAGRRRVAGRRPAGRSRQVQAPPAGEHLGERLRRGRRRLGPGRRAAAVDPAAGPECSRLRGDLLGRRAGRPGLPRPGRALDRRFSAGRFVTVTASPTPAGVTDFSQYTLAQLTQMLYESDPATGTTTAQTWDATGKLLHEQASNLEGRLRKFDGEWQGTASDEYKRMVTDLVGGLRKVADTSFRMRDLTYDAVDSLVAARAAMPAAVDVPVVAPATLALATTPLPIDATTSPAAAAQMQSDQAKAVSAVQAQQAAINSANSAHAQAVAVMQTLADSYVVAQDRFPPTPGGTTPTLNGSGPGTGVTTDHTPVVTNSNGMPILLSDPSQNPSQTPGGPTVPGQQDQASGSLFGDMYTVGLAAAAAAAGGKFAPAGPRGN